MKLNWRDLPLLMALLVGLSYGFVLGGWFALWLTRN